MKFILRGIPRTKKTSPQLLPMMSAQDVVDLLAALKRAMSHKESVGAVMKYSNMRVMPSEAHKEWFDGQILHRGAIRSGFTSQRIVLPIEAPVQVSAIFYRDKEVGDLLGFAQALGDLIQEEMYGCQNCGKRVMKLPQRCPKCNASIAQFRQTRKGLGIIADDKQIISWDGSRLAVDKADPRIEVNLTVLGCPVPKQEGLFVEAPELEEVAL